MQPPALKTEAYSLELFGAENEAAANASFATLLR